MERKKITFYSFIRAVILGAIIIGVCGGWRSAA